MLGGEQSLSTYLNGSSAATPEECQIKCELEPKCNWFNWHDKKFPTGCWLFSVKGTVKVSFGGRKSGATGPKICKGIKRRYQ